MKIVLIGILIIISAVVAGQLPATKSSGSEEKIQIIKWIATFPSDETTDKSGFFEKIFNLVVGIDPVIYNNPVNVYALGIENFWVLNQGDGTILNYHDGKTEKLPVFKKVYNSLPSLVGICRLRSGNFLFTDSRYNKIYILQSDGREYRQFNANDTLSRPTGIAYSELNNEIWVAETGAHRISVFNTEGERIRIIGGRGSGPIQFNFPTYIWIDRSGKVYVVDSMNFRIQVISAAGNLISSFGEQGDATGYLTRPRGIATDSQGNIYIVDALSGVVQIFDISGKLLYYFGSQGRGRAQFWMPSGIFIDKDDYIYISDTYNSRIQVFHLEKDFNKIK